MRAARLFRHLTATRWGTRLAFRRRTLDAIEAAVAQAGKAHLGRICFAIDTAKSPRQLWRGVSVRCRAVEVFAAMRVWDTERNNGVLVYLSLADRAVEIVADRGFQERVRTAEWSAVCKLMQGHFRERRFREGGVAGIEAVGALLTRHFPRSAGLLEAPDGGRHDRPTLL